MKSKFIMLVCVLLAFDIFFASAQPTQVSKGVINVGNAAPLISSVSVTSDATGIVSSSLNPTNESDYVRFTVTWSDANFDSASIFVCKTNSATVSGCTDGTWVNSPSSSVSPRVLDYVTVASDPEVSQAFVFSSDGNLVSAEAPEDQSFYVNHRPFASSVTINPASPREASTLTCTYSFNDPDIGDTERTADVLFQWYISDEGIGSFVLIPGQSSNSLDNTNFDKNDELTCRVRVTDSHGLSDDIFVESNLILIGNSVPSNPSALLIQDGSNPDFDDGSIAHDGNSDFDTHMRTPAIRWTKGTDPDAEDIIYTYVCLSTSLGGCELTGAKTTLSEYNILPGLLNYIGASRTYYLKFIANDGTVNSSGFGYRIFFLLTNDIPTSPSSLTPKSTHNPRPFIDYSDSIDADTTGTIDNFPADTLTYFYSSGTAGPSSTNLVNNQSSAASQFQYTSAIPWSTEGQDAGWNNETVYVRIYSTDGNNGGKSSNYDDSFRLYDYLPDIFQIQIADSGSEYSDQAANPIAHSDASIAIRMQATDRDGDCAFGHQAYASICDNSTITTCTEANAQYRFLLNKISLATGDDCFYEIQGNASIGTPEFWKKPGTWKVKGNITENLSAGSGNQRTADPQINADFIYNELNAANYPVTLYLGDASVELGSFNTNLTAALLENWGNIALNLSWKVTDPISDNDYWNLSVEGNDDFIIDDDTDPVLETVPGVLPVNLTYVNQFFHPSTGLEPCNANACDSPFLNETFGTYYHIRPPLGLAPGLYNNTITLVRVKK